MGLVDGLRFRLAGAFLLVSGGTTVFVAAAVWMNLRAIDQAARLEGEHVARVLASPPIPDAIHHRAALQEFLDAAHKTMQRGAVIVDTGKLGLADVDHSEIGRAYEADPDNEVGRTMADGVARSFVERRAGGTGSMQVVVPFRAVAGDSASPIVGAAIVEYTPIFNELHAAQRLRLVGMAAGGIACVLAATWFGWAVARRLWQYGSDLEQRVEQRTLELGRASALLAQEVRERELAARRIEFLAHYDNLTGLPNRSLFSQRLKQAIEQARQGDRHLAVLVIDLDRFKQINDTLGHDAGDLLLKEMGQRVKAAVPESDEVARLGGDDFAVLLAGQAREDRAAAAADKILAALARPVTLKGTELRITASIGIGTYPDNGDDEGALLKCADMAMYRAKEDGSNQFRFYNERLNTGSLERLTLECALRRALEADEFLLLYQPKLDLRRGGVAGAEALLRWRHPQLGLVPPIKFVQIAEESDLIVPIGEWVLRAACRQQAAWRQDGLPSIGIAVNLSPRQFGDELLVEAVESVLAETGVDPPMLQLEITESTLMQNPQAALETLTDLKRLGVSLAIDDFGTGYSSLSNLKLFPIDTIKMDRAFVRNLPEDANDRGIAEAIIAMGRTLGLTVVAEGAETREQAEFLRARGCDQLQGFYFSQPVAASEVGRMLREAAAPARAQPAGAC